MKSVAIAGRPNVGKSALFNRLAGRRISIVHDQPGVTRDRIATTVKHREFSYELIDTGGIGAHPDPEFSGHTEAAAEAALESADLVLFVVDGRSGLHPVDCELATKFRKLGRPVLLVVNKVDSANLESAIADFTPLGFSSSLSVSAAHGRGAEELQQRIREELGAESGAAEQIRPPHIAIVGRPNVGKSSLINAILGHPRSIVSEIAGTTRDAVDVAYEFNGRPYVLCDTAGIRHRSRHDTSVEVFSVMRSEKTIERADLCLLVLDVTQGLTKQDKKIASLIEKAGKPVIVVANKWDLVPASERRPEGLRETSERLRSELFFFSYAPLLLLSAKTGSQVAKLFRAIETVRAAAGNRIGTGELNRILQTAIERTPPPAKAGQRLKLLYATQVRSAADTGGFEPPAFVLFVNNPALLTPAYQEFLRRRIRDHQEFSGLPVHLKTRGRTKKPTAPA